MALLGFEPFPPGDSTYYQYLLGWGSEQTESSLYVTLTEWRPLIGQRETTQDVLWEFILQNNQTNHLKINNKNQKPSKSDNMSEFLSSLKKTRSNAWQVCCCRNSIQLCHHCHYEWNTSLEVFAALGVQEKCHNWFTYCLMQTISGLYHTLSYYIVSHCIMQIMHHATGATVFSADALQQGFEFESHPVLFCANLVAVFSSFLSSI